MFFNGSKCHIYETVDMEMLWIELIPVLGNVKYIDSQRLMHKNKIWMLIQGEGDSDIVPITTNPCQ